MAKKQPVKKPQPENRVKSDQIGSENTPPTLTTTRMAGEKNRQYQAWLLYYQVGSIRKLFDLWERVGELEGGAKLVSQLKQRPALSTLLEWSGKFQWVKRSELQFEETLTELSEKTKRIDRERKERVAEMFKVAMDKKLKQIGQKDGEPISDTLLNYLWRMHRVEMGLPTDYSKHDIFTPIREEDQKPLTPEEIELSKKITELEIEHNAKLNR